MLLTNKQEYKYCGVHITPYIYYFGHWLLLQMSMMAESNGFNVPINFGLFVSNLRCSQYVFFNIIFCLQLTFLD